VDEGDERVLTNSTPSSKDVVLPAWIADQLQDVELVVVVRNICLCTLLLGNSERSPIERQWSPFSAKSYALMTTSMIASNGGKRARSKPS
jgi:hypothetical protein